MSLPDRLTRSLKAGFKEFFKPDSFVKGEAFEEYARKYIFQKSKFYLDHRSHDYSDNKDDYIKTSLGPDFTFTSKKSKRQFSVEMKFRSRYYDGAIEWCKGYQFKRYKEFDKKLPGFVLLGLEGKANDPDKLFLFPVCKVKYSKLFKSVLNEFEIPPKRPCPEYLIWKLRK